MITDTYRPLYWKTNAQEFLGFPPASLVVADYDTGGGFAGAPEVLYLYPVTAITADAPRPEAADFPPPGAALEYRVGGATYRKHAYFNPNLVGRS